MISKDDGEEKTVLKLISLKDALELIRGAFSEYFPRVEEVKVEDAAGRVSADDVYSAVNVPAYPVAAVDGYSVASVDLEAASVAHPVRLREVGGGLGRLSRGEAVYVNTGSWIPDGADAVVKRENARRVGGYVEIVRRVPRGKNIMPAGEVVRVGDKIVGKGRRIRPEEVAMLMEVGIERVAVYRRCRVALIAVGDELYEGYQERGVRAINYAYIAARKIEAMGGEVSMIDVSPDDPVTLEEKLGDAAQKCEAVFTLGGCSVGENDIVPKVVVSMPGASILFHGIRCMPAKPSGFAMLGARPILMLPGHVVSMTAALYLLGRPLLNILQGLVEPEDVVVFASCGDSVAARPGMGQLVFVRIEKAGNGYVAHPFGWGTNSLRSIAWTDGFIMLEEGRGVERGQVVPVHLIR
ncbi:Molybdopterin molybdenumtransferase [Candidatus Calditenuaceae archaeon HR02]|nr:Molybdopterin molybdenumtransferase [Candidatus Calditenuaceae archaeon HR02]